MNIWLLMALGGLITFGMRFSFIYLFGRFEIPHTLEKALRYVPPAVLCAIIFPEVLMPQGQLFLSVSNDRLVSGLVAVVVAFFSRNTLLTIIAGMATLFVLKFVF